MVFDIIFTTQPHIVQESAPSSISKSNDGREARKSIKYLNHSIPSKLTLNIDGGGKWEDRGAVPKWQKPLYP